MRITPNLPRLRIIALSSWVVASCCIVYGAQSNAASLQISAELLGLLLLVVGLIFWLLSSDYRAGIVFDAKGILLNLGHSSSFISWDNIERIGVTTYRSSLFTLGSRQQVGFQLRDPQKYIQSYEERLPTGRGAFMGALRAIDTSLRPLWQHDDRALKQQIASCRAKTGYDVLVPEAQLGGKVQSFAALLEAYRVSPSERRILTNQV